MFPAVNLRIRRRLRLPYEVSIETPGGTFRYRTNKRDALYVRTTEANFGGWERVPRKFFASLAMDSRTVIDVGAYSGIYSLIALAASPECVVHAIEPMPQNYETTKKNLLINRQFESRRWAVHNFAASDQVGSRTIFFDERVSLDTASLEEEFRAAPTSQLSIPTVSLDSLGLKNVDLMKIDVEGHEHKTLRGAQRILRESAPFVLFESLTTRSLELCRSEFLVAGYESFALLDARKKVYLAIPSNVSAEVKTRKTLVSKQCREENLTIELFD